MEIFDGRGKNSIFHLTQLFDFSELHEIVYFSIVTTDLGKFFRKSALGYLLPVNRSFFSFVKPTKASSAMLPISQFSNVISSISAAPLKAFDVISSTFSSRSSKYLKCAAVAKFSFLTNFNFPPWKRTRIISPKLVKIALGMWSKSENENETAVTLSRSMSWPWNIVVLALIFFVSLSAATIVENWQYVKPFPRSTTIWHSSGSLSPNVTSSANNKTKEITKFVNLKRKFISKAWEIFSSLTSFSSLPHASAWFKLMRKDSRFNN